MSSNSLSLTNTRTGIFDDIYMVRNNSYVSIYDLFYDGTDLYDKATIDSMLLDKANVITLNNFMAATNTSLTLKANLNNPSFTGNIGVNRSTSSALEVAGQKALTSVNNGIRFGFSEMFPGLATGYGITLQSTDGCAIDFTGNGSNNFYFGRLLFNNADYSFYFLC